MNGDLILKAIKIIYPSIEGGYIYWENQVNPVDGLIWENKIFPKPKWEDIQKLIPQIELEDAKTKKINEIGNAKEEALYAPIAYLNASFSASERACQNMLGNLVLNGETVEWQDLTKKPIIMTRAQFQTLAVMVKNQRNASYFKEGELMKKIALAKTPEELNLIKW